LLIGAHVSVAGGVSLAFERAEAIQARSFQIFTRSSRTWTSKPLFDQERRAFRDGARRTGLPSIAHGSYLANLGASEPQLWEKSVSTVIEELTRCERLGVPSLVIHPGVNPDAQEGIARVASALDRVHTVTPRFRSQICLEVTAGQGNCLGWRFEHLAAILERVHRSDRLGVCLDTCHLFAAGYDISGRRGYEKVMKEFDLKVGLHRVRCLHLNDCKKPLGSRVDRHEEVGKGQLGLDVFRRLVNDPQFERTVAVLETPHPALYAQAIGLLESLVRT